MIEISNLSKHFGDVRAVRNLDLHVPRGELFCFLGPNGAGKTTTIKILTGLLRPTHGRACVDGIDVQAEPVKAKQVIGYIPDMPYLYPRLTPAEFMEFTGEVYRIPPARTAAERDRLFTLFGLTEQAASLIKDLSHGMRQRLIYAATLLHEPRVLFIDEPLIGLDPYTIRLIKDLLREKARAGTTIFLTTHILALAEDIADRIGIVMDGRLVALGTIPDLLGRVPGATGLEDLFIGLTTEQPDRPEGEVVGRQ